MSACFAPLACTAMAFSAARCMAMEAPISLGAPDRASNASPRKLHTHGASNGASLPLSDTHEPIEEAFELSPLDQLHHDVVLVVVLDRLERNGG